MNHLLARKVRSTAGKLLIKANAALLWFRIAKMRHYYPIVMRRLRGKLRSDEPIKVLFIVTEPAKWKLQSLYDLMAGDSRFHVQIGVSCPDFAGEKNKSDALSAFNAACDFFAARNMPTIKLWLPDKATPSKLHRNCADIIFYQQVWFDVKWQMPYDVCKWAISCYIPYFVANYGDVAMECLKPLHRLFNYHFVQDEEWKHLYESALGRVFRVGRMVGLGHPMLDYIEFDPKCGDGKQCVIYAPHWTINPHNRPGCLNYATFLWNGREILEYAKRHKEMNWVFKPHPNLAYILEKFKVMSRGEIDEYYTAWAQIGRVEMSGDYHRLFNESSSLVTDCGSFLTEYVVTGKPIIHLISATCTHKPLASSSFLYPTYYQARSLDEMYSLFSSILERREDPKRNVRVSALRKAICVEGKAASRILNFILDEIAGKAG
ncbi:MAG: hypothetical protein K6G91_09300 [Kiritimatiellae bacterium]|nr:hypothetical protein [Kiritimatiellia bacterium]